MSKITKTLETNSLLQSHLTHQELWDLFILIYRKNTEVFRLSTFFSRMYFVSGNTECDIISSRIYEIHNLNYDIDREFEQQLRMGKNIKIELVAQFIKLNSEVKNILNLIRNMDLNDYYLIFKNNEKEKDDGFEQMKLKYNTENQPQTNHLKIVR